MKKRNIRFIFGIMVLICACFISCNNPIIGKWWGENEQQEPEYVAIIKDVPMYIYETIIENEYIYKYVYETVIEYYPEYTYVDKPLPPEIILEHIAILNIDFIVFSGNQTVYNKESALQGGTSLSQTEIDANNTIVKSVIQELIDHEEIFLILHGHANPIDYTPEETIQLTQISEARAVSVKEKIEKVLRDTDADIDIIPDDNKLTEDEIKALLGRMDTKGYGGGKNIAGPTSTYGGLNRRVEVILFSIEADPAAAAARKPPPPQTGGY